MLTIRTCKIFSKALGEYLRQADYYAEGMKVEGTCCGRLCAAVGLTEGIAISDEAFGRIASNHHAGTGEQLTERMKEGRRAGYDAVFNAPKSVSIQAFLGGDERLILAHERAVNEALQELETSACHQDGQGMNKRYVTSGKIAAAVFRHGESRALDPQMAAEPNTTTGASHRLRFARSSATDIAGEGPSMRTCIGSVVIAPPRGVRPAGPPGPSPAHGTARWARGRPTGPTRRARPSSCGTGSRSWRTTLRCRRARTAA